MPPIPSCAVIARAALDSNEFVLGVRLGVEALAEPLSQPYQQFSLVGNRHPGVTPNHTDAWADRNRELDTIDSAK